MWYFQFKWCSSGCGLREPAAHGELQKQALGQSCWSLQRAVHSGAGGLAGTVHMRDPRWRSSWRTGALGNNKDGAAGERLYERPQTRAEERAEEGATQIKCYYLTTSFCAPQVGGGGRRVSTEGVLIETGRESDFSFAFVTRCSIILLIDSK